MAQESRENWGHQDKALPACGGLTKGLGGSLQKAWLGLGQSQLREASAELGWGSESEALPGWMQLPEAFTHMTTRCKHSAMWTLPSCPGLLWQARGDLRKPGPSASSPRLPAVGWKESHALQNRHFLQQK